MHFKPCLFQISAFLKELNFDKFRPPDLSDTALENGVSQENEVSDRKKAETAVFVGNKMTNGNLANTVQTKDDVKRVKATSKFLSNVKARKHLLFKPEDIWREEKVKCGLWR